jgi:anti-sigma B factor antagonist
MEPVADSLLVAIRKEWAFVRVLGRGSFKVSPALKKFGVAAMERSCHGFVVDMAECIGMDSTFMGVLAGLSLHLQRRGGGKIVMINVSGKNTGLLQTVGLNVMLEIREAGEAAKEPVALPQGDGEMKPLDTAYAGRKVTAETMLAAHEDLIEVSPENFPRFKDVLAYLKEDLKSATESDEKNR